MWLLEPARLAQVFRDLSLYMQIKGENAFKTRAYDMAAEKLVAMSPADLERHVREATLTDLPGIGEGLAKKIDELVRTGRLELVEAMRAEFPAGILTLMELADVGPKKVKALFEGLGVGSVDALEAACRAGRVRTLKGFSEKSETKLLEAVAAFKARSSSARFLWLDARRAAQSVYDVIASAPGVIRQSFAGSLRRGRDTVADVDIVVSAADANPIFERVVAHPFIAQVLGRGETKCSVILKDSGLQIDVRVLPDEDFGTALHHFTGSKAHHVHLRNVALTQGLSISEWGVFRGDTKLQAQTEEALYAHLGLPFIPPELREDWGEIEAAAAGTLPVDLIEERHIAGNVHAHTTWSDGKDSLEAMARAAQKMGLSYLTVTEHSASATYAGGLSRDALERSWEEIDRVNEALVGFRLLKGIESDILEDGSLDYPDDVLEKFDVVIGSIHQRYGQDEAAMTARVLKAFDNPHLMIWGHATGRLLNKREPAAMDMDRILDRAAQKGIVIEVNGCPERLDVKAEHARAALKRGLKLVCSTDAHAVHELSLHLPLSVATARRGWARRGDVLNALPVDAFLKSVRRA